jgi:hypothetical protein
MGRFSGKWEGKQLTQRVAEEAEVRGGKITAS